MRLTELLEGSEHVRPPEALQADPEIAGIEIDSRRVQPGTLFVALVGAAADGHRFVDQAIARGAAAVLVNRGWHGESSVPVCVADDTRLRLGELASHFYGAPSEELDVVGVTGTNGKTTITYLLEAVFGHVDRIPGVIGTVNYRWPGHAEPALNTTPESLVIQRMLRRMVDAGVDSVAMEVSSHGLATHRLRGTRFDVGIFTNLTQDHLDFHGDMASYRAAKHRLFSELLVPGSSAVVNVDDEHGASFVAATRDAEVVTYSAAGADADWRCIAWTQDVDGTHMAIEHAGTRFDLSTRLLGGFNVSNVLATVAAASVLGIDPMDCADALHDLRGVPGRLQYLGGDGKPRVFVDYAHTPDALGRALDALRPLARRRLVVVFGCGGNRDREKRPRMGRIAFAAADFVVVTSDNPRDEPPEDIIADVRRGLEGPPTDDLGSGAGWSAVLDRREAILRTIAEADPDDVILVAGKGHETYQEALGVRVELDDAAVVAEALR